MLHIAANHPCYDKDVNQHTIGLSKPVPFLDPLLVSEVWAAYTDPR